MIRVTRGFPSSPVRVALVEIPFLGTTRPSGATTRDQYRDLRRATEPIAHRSLRGAGITGWVADHEVWLTDYGLAVLDLAFLGLRVLVEIDGWAFHRDLRAFLRDIARQNALILGGWVVIRTTWYELTESPELFVRNVVEALGAQRAPSKI